MTDRRPSHSPADDDSDFLWQSTCGSDISPCLAAPEPSGSERSPSHSRIRGDSLEELSDSQQLDSFELEGVELPESAGDAPNAADRRARWRGAEIYSGPTHFADDQRKASPSKASVEGATQTNPSTSAAGGLPPVAPLVGTMLAAGLAFLAMVALPGQFGGTTSPPKTPETKGPVAAADPPAPIEAPPLEPSAAKPAPAAETKPEEKGPPVEVTPMESEPPPAVSLPVAPIEAPMTPTKPPLVTPPALPAVPAPATPPVVPPAAVPEKVTPPATEAPSAFAGHLAEQKLSIARQLEAAGRIESAMKRYEQLIEQYPKTNVATEAAARLKNLKDALK